MGNNVTQIFKVTTQGDCEGRSTKVLGYATGNVALIERYFDKQKTYSLSIEPVNLINVTIEEVEKKEALEKCQKELKLQLEQVEKSLKGYK